MQKLQIFIINIINSVIKLILIKKLNRINRQTVLINSKTEINLIIRFKDLD